MSENTREELATEFTAVVTEAKDLRKSQSSLLGFFYKSVATLLVHELVSEALAVVRKARVTLWKNVIDAEMQSFESYIKEIPFLVTISQDLKERAEALRTSLSDVLSKIDEKDPKLPGHLMQIRNDMRQIVDETQRARDVAAKETFRAVFWKGLTACLTAVIILFWFTGANVWVAALPFVIWLSVLPLGYFAVRKYPSLTRNKAQLLGGGVVLLLSVTVGGYLIASGNTESFVNASSALAFGALVTGLLGICSRVTMRSLQGKSESKED